MASGDGPACRLSAGKQPTFLQGSSRIVSRRTGLPPLPQQAAHLIGQLHIAVLTTLRLLDANDFLFCLDMLDLEPHDLTCPQSAAIAEAEKNTRLEIARHCQQSLHLVDTHHQRKLLWLADVI